MSSISDEPTGYHSVAQVAQKLGISRNFAWSLIWSGKLQAKRIGRRVLISPQQIQDYVDSCPNYLDNAEVDRG